MTNLDPGFSSSPPGRGGGKPDHLGQGYKYALIRDYLGQEPSEYVQQRREHNMPYSQIAEQMNATLLRQGSSERVTQESMRRWDPDGEFLRLAVARKSPSAPTPPAPPPPTRTPFNPGPV